MTRQVPFRSRWFVVAILALSPAALAQTTMTLVDEAFDAESLTLRVRAADVVIEAWAEPHVHVLAVQSGGRPGAFRVTATLEDGALVVRDEARPMPFGGAGLSYAIRVPASVPLDVEVSSGNLRVDGSRAPCTIETASGNVEVARFAGRLEVRVSSGNVDVMDATFELAELRTRSGNLRLRSVRGPMTLHSDSGNVTVLDADDAVLAMSGASGNLEFAGRLRPGLAHAITQGSGNVTVRLAPDAGVRIDASTVSGSVTAQVQLLDATATRTSLTGVFGDGTARLEVRVASGNVIIERY